MSGKVWLPLTSMDFFTSASSSHNAAVEKQCILFYPSIRSYTASVAGFTQRKAGEEAFSRYPHVGGSTSHFHLNVRLCRAAVSETLVYLTRRLEVSFKLQRAIYAARATWIGKVTI